jgi:hypothetical protein
MDKIFIGRRRAGRRLPGDNATHGTRAADFRKFEPRKILSNRSPIRSCAVATMSPAHFTFRIPASLKRFNSCYRPHNRNAWRASACPGGKSFEAKRAAPHECASYAMTFSL